MEDQIIETAAMKLGKDGAWIGLSDIMIKKLGIEENLLLMMKFSVRLNDNKIVIESHIPGREQLSINSIPGKVRTNQGED